MKILEIINNLLSQERDKISLNKNKDVIDNYNVNVVKAMQQREQEMFGVDRLQQQKLYEKWAVKETWLLKNEAIPLLFGINPESDQNFDLLKLNELWEHAQHCVAQNLLPVIEPDLEPENWRVRPQDVYKWAAISRIDIPEALSALMNFVMSVVKNPDVERTVDNINYANEDNLHHSENDRERILGAALAILAAYPDKCRNEKGQVDVARIIGILEDKGEFWFNERMPSLSEAARYDLINRWLRTVC